MLRFTDIVALKANDSHVKETSSLNREGTTKRAPRAPPLVACL